MVKEVVEKTMPDGPPVDIVTQRSDDTRSYRINSDKIRRELGFVPRRTIQDAVHDLLDAFRRNLIPNSLEDVRYYNVKTLQHAQLV